MEGGVRMHYLENLLRDSIKMENVCQEVEDNSTWSLSISPSIPPRVAVGSNAHTVTILNLHTREEQRINAHRHNVPCVSFSPCGNFLASTSIDKTVKIWGLCEKTGKFKFLKAGLPSNDWGWAVEWLPKDQTALVREPKKQPQSQAE